MRFDVEKWIFITRKLPELKSATLVQRAYRSKFNGKMCTTNRTILGISKKFDITGTVLDLAPKPKNERKTRTEARIKLKILFTENLSLSLRKASVDVGNSYYFLL